MTTNSDAVFDTGLVDLGYHHSPNIIFELYMTPLKTTYCRSERPKIMLDVKTSIGVGPLDIYFTLNSPSGSVYSGMNWEEGARPLFQDISFTRHLELCGIEIMEMDLLSGSLPMAEPGYYTFAFAAMEPETGKLHSNLATLEFPFHVE